jgi:hypothetical protein
MTCGAVTVHVQQWFREVSHIKNLHFEDAQLLQILSAGSNVMEDGRRKVECCRSALTIRSKLCWAVMHISTALDGMSFTRRVRVWV